MLSNWNGAESSWRRFGVQIGVVVLLSALMVFVGIVLNNRQVLEEEMLARSRAYFASIVLTREWNARHGGVFVEKTPGMESNPYLKNPEIQAADGTVYTKKNPALMTREISEIAARHGAFRFHITSLKPINPDNAPDAFERDALLAFEKGVREATVRADDGGRPIFRYMAPLSVEPACLQCHAEQGYTPGDIRGGISVSFDSREIEATAARSGLITGLLFFVTVAAILGAIFLSVTHLRTRLKTSDLRWRFALEGADDGVWDWNLVTGAVFFSSQWKAMLGFAESDLGDTVGDWENRVHPDDLARSHALLESHFRQETPVYVNEHRLRGKDGVYKWILARGKVVEWTDDGKPLRMIGTHADISRQKEIETSLREGEAYMQALLSSVSVGIGIDDLTGRSIKPNPGLARMVGYSPEEMQGRPFTAFTHPDDAEADLTLFTDVALGKRKSYQLEKRYLHKDGRIVWGRLTRSAVTDEFGAILYCVGMVEDINDRKLAEAALQHSEARLKAILDSSPTAIFLKDVERRYLLVNPTYRVFHGLETVEILGRTADDFQTPDQVARTVEEDNRALAGEPLQVFEEVRPNSDGGSRHFTTYKFPVRDAFGAIIGVGGISVDFTQRVRIEEALRDSEEKFRLLVENQTDLLVKVDVEGRFLFVSPSYCRLFGQPETDLLGKTFMPLVHEDDRAATAKAMEALWTPPHTCYLEQRAMTSNGWRWLGWNDSVILDDLGKIKAIIGVGRDITDLKVMERQLVQAQKMEMVGQLTGGIAHDFNNMLQVIQGNLAMARLRVEDDAATLTFIDNAVTAGWRGAKLTQQLLSFSRKQTLFPKVVDPNDLIEGMLNMLGRTLGEDIRIVTGLADDVPPIVVDPSGLENSMLNLAVNARTAMPGGGTLTVTTRVHRLATDLVLGEGDRLPAGDYVEIAVADTGCGMEADVLEHAFEPFFTTKDVGEGSGLGLSMVYGFTHQSAGHLTLESEPGRGTTARLLLPTTTDRPDARKDEPHQAGARKTTGTILVVEDDPNVRQSAVMMLEGLGYDTREAANGADALKILGRNRGIDLLFSDVVMPEGMNGLDLAQEAVRRHPSLKVLLTSGYPESHLQSSGLAGRDIALLAKPYSAEGLSDAIAAALSA